MSKTLLLAMAMLLCASLALAQAGSIGIFAKAATDCNMVDADIPQTVWVVHVLTAGATKAKFKIVESAGVHWSLLGSLAEPPYTSTGNPLTGIEITYGACVAGPNAILQLWYACPGGSCPPVSATCSSIEVVPADGETDVLVWDCSAVPQQLDGTGGTLVINPDLSCNCNIPVEDATWGALKALFLVE